MMYFVGIQSTGSFGTFQNWNILVKKYLVKNIFETGKILYLIWMSFQNIWNNTCFQIKFRFSKEAKKLSKLVLFFVLSGNP